jgi:ribosomal-protein-alanine N-acetyltransferase
MADDAQQTAGREPVETDRLLLSHARLSDVAALFGFLGNHAAMQFTHIDETFADCRKRVLVHEWFRRRDGFAPWVIRKKSDRTIIGWGGVYTDPFDPGWGPEVGYYFHPDSWGQGFATELLEASLHYAAHIYRLPVLTAFAHPDNAASRRLLEKSGFETQEFVPEMNRYCLKRRF